jgi:hypothetical protein
MSQKGQKLPVRQPKPQRPPVEPRDPNKAYVEEITDEQLRLIGSAISVWSKLEKAIEEVIWALLDTDISIGRVVTGKLDAAHKLELFRGMTRIKIGVEELESINILAGRIQELYGHRNMFAHGHWVTTTPDNMPATISFRDKLLPGTDGNEVVATYCPADFMTTVIDNMKICTNHLVSLRNQLRSVPE